MVGLKPQVSDAELAALSVLQALQRFTSETRWLRHARQGLPVTFAVTGAKADERQVLLHLLDADPALLASRPSQTMIGDKHPSNDH